MVVNVLIANSLIEWNASFNTTPLKSSRPLLFYPMRHWLTVFVSTNASFVSPTIAENMAKCTQCMMGGLMHHILKKTLTQRVLEGLGPRVVWWLTTNLCIFTVVSIDNLLTIEHRVVMIRVSFPPNAIKALYHRWYIFYFIFYSLFFIFFFYIWKTLFLNLYPHSIECTLVFYSEFTLTHYLLNFSTNEMSHNVHAIATKREQAVSTLTKWQIIVFI